MEYEQNKLGRVDQPFQSGAFSSRELFHVQAADAPFFHGNG
jgi:hypothetical protein